MWIFEHIGPEIVRDPGLLGSLSPSFLSLYFPTFFTLGQIYMWTWGVELETDCCLHLIFQGDMIAGTQGRPPSYSDMVSRPHYLKSCSFVLVYMSLCLVLILVTRTYTFLPLTPVEIIHSKSANKDWVGNLCKRRGVKNPSLEWIHLVPSSFAFPLGCFYTIQIKLFFF